jgi:hypothetical protein
MILRILQVEEGIQEKVLQNHSYKGSFLPHMKYSIKGFFISGSVKSLDGHPLFEMKSADFKALASGDKFTLRPT